MTMLLYMNFDELHKLSFRNRGVLSTATQCGCFYCKRLFARLKPPNGLTMIAKKLHFAPIVPLTA